MSEKVVAIYVTREFRNKIKAEKHELTYEKFLDSVLEKTKGKPSAKKTQETNPGDFS